MLIAKSHKFNSVLISADSNIELGETFMRFQEYYESPNPQFRKQIFTRGQYLHWYSTQYGANSYCTDWSGYNFPSYVLTPFKDGFFDPLTDKEQELLNLFKYRKDRFYIIGANEESTIRHELAHALFYTNSDYFIEITKLLDQHHINGSLIKSEQYLLDKGYTNEVLYDEIQAYVTDNDDNEVIKNAPTDLIIQINSIYKKYALDNAETV